MNKDVIIALDFPTASKTLDFLSLFKDERPYVKVGMELYYAEGAALIKELKTRGMRVFLDLKLHDIPNTVKRTMSVLSSCGVDMVNLHASGTRAMMEAALEGLTRPNGTRPLLIAVTLLTSISEEALCGELAINETPEQTAVRLAYLAKQSGLDGVVCSPLEAGAVHEKCGRDFLTVTPGIRFADSEKGDQSRIATPLRARAESDYIVVGRPITASPDPLEAYKRCIKDFLGKDIK
ncbi:MAG TPA: orotidine-5'-phosphate decarboxylase [Bacillota bacterium]|nr:orotidine-5'-phosphate decarboxylase [Bacillota bacterium]